MSIIKMTARQIIDLGLWDRVCEYKGINPYAVNEGLMKDSDIIEFDTEFKKEEPQEQELCYVIYSYNGETYQERDAEYVRITKNNQETLRDAIDRIISNGNIVGKIVLESELE